MLLIEEVMLLLARKLFLCSLEAHCYRLELVSLGG